MLVPTPGHVRAARSPAQCCCACAASVAALTAITARWGVSATRCVCATQCDMAGCCSPAMFRALSQGRGACAASRTQTHWISISHA